jgi:hypothetical protein
VPALCLTSYTAQLLHSSGAHTHPLRTCPPLPPSPHIVHLVQHAPPPPAHPTVVPQLLRAPPMGRRLVRFRPRRPRPGAPLPLARPRLGFVRAARRGRPCGLGSRCPRGCVAAARRPCGTHARGRCGLCALAFVAPCVCLQRGWGRRHRPFVGGAHVVRFFRWEFIFVRHYVRMWFTSDRFSIKKILTPLSRGSNCTAHAQPLLRDVR